MASDIDDLADQVVKSVLMLARRLRAERPEDSPGLSALGILATIRRLQPISAVRLAEEERLAPQSLTRILAMLEANRWIERRRGEKDRRALLISLTEAGLEALKSDLRGRSNWLAVMLATELDDGERATLARAAGIMRRLSTLPADDPVWVANVPGDDRKRRRLPMAGGLAGK